MNTDLFSAIEEKLYIGNPELRSKNIYFCANGNIIDRNATLEKNKIKYGDQILILMANTSIE